MHIEKSLIPSLTTGHFLVSQRATPLHKDVPFSFVQAASLFRRSATAFRVSPDALFYGIGLALSSIAVGGWALFQHKRDVMKEIAEERRVLRDQYNSFAEKRSDSPSLANIIDYSDFHTFITTRQDYATTAQKHAALHNFLFCRNSNTNSINVSRFWEEAKKRSGSNGCHFKCNSSNWIRAALLNRTSYQYMSPTLTNDEHFYRTELERFVVFLNILSAKLYKERVLTHAVLQEWNIGDTLSFFLRPVRFELKNPSSANDISTDKGWEKVFMAYIWSDYFTDDTKRLIADCVIRHRENGLLRTQTKQTHLAHLYSSMHYYLSFSDFRLFEPLVSFSELSDAPPTTGDAKWKNRFIISQVATDVPIFEINRKVERAVLSKVDTRESHDFMTHSKIPDFWWGTDTYCQSRLKHWISKKWQSEANVDKGEIAGKGELSPEQQKCNW